MFKQQAVIFDMDGTLSDCRHRLRYLLGPGKKNWDKFFDGSKDDKPHPQIVRLAHELSTNNAIIIASGRPEQLLLVTEEWLRRFDVPFAAIYLRRSNDRRADGDVKADMFALMKADGFEPWLAVDDRDTAVAAWRKLGLCCMQCAESHY